MLTTAIENVHYHIGERGWCLTLRGQRELTKWQQQEMFAFSKKHGYIPRDEFTFRPFVIKIEEEETHEDENQEIPCGDEGDEDRLADKLYEEQRDGRWDGLVYCRRGPLGESR